MLKMRDYVLAYIRSKSNIADQFTKIVDPISHRRFREWIANGLDDDWDGEVVETLQTLFQQCKLREMAEKKKTQRKAINDSSTKDSDSKNSKKHPRAKQLISTIKLKKRRKVNSSRP